MKTMFKFNIGDKVKLRGVWELPQEMQKFYRNTLTGLTGYEGEISRRWVVGVTSYGRDVKCYNLKGEYDWATIPEEMIEGVGGMKHSKNVIMSALEIIKDMCSEYNNCTDCPFGTKYDDCLIRKTMPEKWNINNAPKDIWRALHD